MPNARRYKTIGDRVRGHRFTLVPMLVVAPPRKSGRRRKPPRKSRRRRKPQRTIAEYEALDHDGALLGLVGRNTPNNFTDRGQSGAGWYAITPDCRRLPFKFRDRLQAALALREHARKEHDK